jgi:hypothetical protein
MKVGVDRTMLRTAERVPRSMIALFAIGVGIRLGLMALYDGPALQNADTISYLTSPLFADSREPSGFELFSEPFRWIGSLPLLVSAMHVVGVLAAGLLAATARRLGCAWISTGAVAAVALLGSEELYLEHALLSEPLFTALAACALLLVLSAERSVRLAPVSIAGAVASMAACTRSSGLLVVGGVVLGVYAIASGSAARRLLRSVVAAAGAAGVLGAYLLAASITPHGWAGIGDWRGWYTYARAAPFADCRQFRPPAGTQALCEGTPPKDRPGPAFYMFNEASPARLAFTRPPFHGDVLARFGRAAIAAQPTAYAHAVLRDSVRYVDDDFGRERPYFGGGYETIALDRRSPPDERTVAQALSDSSFGMVRPPVVHAPHLLELYAAIFAIGGRGLLLLLGLSAAAVALTRGPRRRAAAIYVAVASALLLLPVLTIIYNARYAIPAALLLTVPAAVGVEALAGRIGRQRLPTATADEPRVSASAPTVVRA